MEVAERGDLGQLVAQFLGEGAVVGEVRPGDGDVDRRRRAEAHHLADDVGRLEREPHVRQLRRKLPAQPLLEPFDVDLRPLLHGDAEDGLLRAAGPLVDGIDRVARRDQPHVADRDRHLVAADLLGRSTPGRRSPAARSPHTGCRRAPASGAGTARRRPWGRSPGRATAPPARSPRGCRRGKPARSPSASARRRPRPGHRRRVLARTGSVAAVLPQPGDGDGGAAARSTGPARRCWRGDTRSPWRSRRPATAGRRAPEPLPA